MTIVEMQSKISTNFEKEQITATTIKIVEEVFMNVRRYMLLILSI